MRNETQLTVLDICSGGGGEALGLEAAGFVPEVAVEIDPVACQTLCLNRPGWRVIESDIRDVDGTDFRGVDLLAGGVPCPPFTVAGKQLGADDERDLFPEALRLIAEAQPRAVLLENVPGLASTRFTLYRNELLMRLHRLGYEVQWRILNSSAYGVPQLRPRFILVALRSPWAQAFRWPQPVGNVLTVGQTIGDLMATGGWKEASQWACRANGIAPTLVGGSKKHGGPDLGPTRAREQWRALGVDGRGMADFPPDEDFPLDGHPRLTLRMAARLQAFPDTWTFAGGKTAAYRQIGNALPPPLAQAIGEAIRSALRGQADMDLEYQSTFYQPFLLHL